MIKKYVSINAINLTTSVMVDGRRTIINFSGGNRTPRGKVVVGSFITDNVALQEAIESDVGYNRDFVCISHPSNPNPDDIVGKVIIPGSLRAMGSDGREATTVPINPNPDTTQGESIATNEVADQGVQTAIVNEVTNKQQAIEWLSANKQIKLRPTLSVADVKKVAEENGVIFSNWL